MQLWRADKPQDVEAAVVDVLNHEVLHALRQLDLITESELKMLEKLATKYKKSGTEQTYEQWAIENYPNLRNRPTALIEEAVAEMVRDGIAGRVVMESKPVKLTGKPRSIIKRIVDFFRGLFNVARDANASSFTEFLTALEAGEIGLRERGKIRTLYRLERATGRFLDRDDPFTERDALQEAITEGAKAVVDEEDIEVRAGQALDQYPKFAQLSLAELEEYSPANPAGKGDYKTDLGVPDEDTYFRLLDAKKRLEQGEATAATEKTPEQKAEEERLAKVAGLDQVMFSRRTPAYASGSGRQIARDQLANDLEQAGIEYEYPLSDFDAGDFAEVNPISKRLIMALEREDFLGYDNLDLLLNDLFNTDLDAFDVSNAFRTALGRFVNESSMADMSEVVLASEPPPIDPSRLPELQEKAKQRREQKQKIKDLFALLNGKTGAQAARELQNVVITDKGYRDLAGALAARLESLESVGLTNTIKVIEVGDKAPSRFAGNSGVLGTWQSKPFKQPYEATVLLGWL